MEIIITTCLTIRFLYIYSAVGTHFRNFGSASSDIGRGGERQLPEDGRCHHPSWPNLTCRFIVHSVRDASTGPDYGSVFSLPDYTLGFALLFRLSENGH